jgi:glycosyltransferase involved in cell wall biosynthesis
MTSKPKIAFVVQRYGADFAGGAESLTKRIAEGMTRDWDVTALSTCAKDYRTWENEYSEGAEQLNGVTVIRFRNTKTRDLAQFSKFRYDPANISAEEERWFFNEQGPYCPDLISFIRQHKDDFQAFIFVTYLYYQTIFGVPEVADKAYLISTAHDEPPFHLKRTLAPIFKSLKGLIYLSEAELKLIESFYPLEKRTRKIKAGFGVDVPSDARLQDLIIGRTRFDEKLRDDFFLYLGRASVTKLCDKMFSAFGEFKRRTGSRAKLLLGGSLDLEIPNTIPDIEYLGFLSEEEKSILLSKSLALVNPSATESLSIVIQESWAHKKPVIINAESEVMLEFCKSSAGGLYYHSPEVFSASFEIMAEHKELANEMGLSGHRFVTENCTWESYRKALVNGVDV